jgi:hypothetical protein
MKMSIVPRAPEAAILNYMSVRCMKMASNIAGRMPCLLSEARLGAPFCSRGRKVRRGEVKVSNARLILEAQFVYHADIALHRRRSFCEVAEVLEYLNRSVVKNLRCDSLQVGFTRPQAAGCSARCIVGFAVVDARKEVLPSRRAAPNDAHH